MSVKKNTIHRQEKLRKIIYHIFIYVGTHGQNNTSYKSLSILTLIGHNNS